MSLVSVIIPYRNAEKYIFETINSIYSQTYADVELVFIDNGSSDSSRQIVDSHICQRHNAIQNLSFPTAGKSLALNYAITKSSGEWIAICDADDLWAPEKLEKQALRMSSGVDIIGTQMRYINESGALLSFAPHLPTKCSEIYAAILDKKENPICNSSVIYRKTIHTDVVGFYDPLCAVEDYDLWSRCVFAGLQFFNLDDALVEHRIHDGSHFNDSKKQALHKDLIDARNNALQQIRILTNDGN